MHVIKHVLYSLKQLVNILISCSLALFFKLAKVLPTNHFNYVDVQKLPCCIDCEDTSSVSRNSKPCQCACGVGSARRGVGESRRGSVFSWFQGFDDHHLTSKTLVKVEIRCAPSSTLPCSCLFYPCLLGLNNFILFSLRFSPLSFLAFRVSQKNPNSPISWLRPLPAFASEGLNQSESRIDMLT